MKIAFVGQNWKGDSRLVSECHILDIAERMSAQGHDVTLYGKNIAKKTAGSKKIHFVKVPQRRFLSDAFSIAHIYFGNYNVIHDVSGNSEFFRSAVKKLVPEAIFVSMNELQCPFGVKNSKTKKTYAQLRGFSKFGLRNKRYMLFVGSLEKNSGAHYLIEAFKYLEDTAKTPNNFKLVIANDEGGDDLEYEKYLNFMAKGRHNIVFVGRQKKEALKNLYSCAYLFVQPSDGDFGKRRLLEAMGYGIAPLVSDAQENMDLIGGAGFSFDSKSIKNLQEKLAYLLNRPQEVEHAGLLAKERIKSEYSCDSVAKKTIDTYRQMMVTK